MLTVLIETWGTVLADYFLQSLISIAIYVLNGWGLYTIAKRRGIRYAWLAWVPVASVWILGSISDDYHQKVKGRPRKFRVVLVWLTAAAFVLMLLFYGAAYGVMLPAMEELMPMEQFWEFYELAASGYADDAQLNAFAMDMGEQIEQNMSDALLDSLMGSLVLVLLTSLLYLAAEVTAAVFRYICLYDLFASCDPKHKVLYLVLSILFGLDGIFIFACRNRDDGMFPPPPPLPYGYGAPYGGYGYGQPPYQPPYQPPRDPWQQPGNDGQSS